MREPDKDEALIIEKARMYEQWIGNSCTKDCFQLLKTKIEDDLKKMFEYGSAEYYRAHGRIQAFEFILNYPDILVEQSSNILIDIQDDVEI